MISIDITLLISFLTNFLIQFGVVVFIIFIATQLKRFIIHFHQKRGDYQSNRAVAISTTGFYISTILILFTSLQKLSYEYISDIVSILSISLLGILFLIINRFILKLFYFQEFNQYYELDRENIAFAIFQISGFIATSILFYKSFAGVEFTLEAVAIKTLYFLIGQISLFIFVKIFILMTPYDDVREIQRGNIAVSIDFFSIFLSLSLLFGNIVKEVVNIDLTSIAYISIYFLISSLPFIYIPNLITSLISSGGKRVTKSISDGNMVVAIKSGTIKIAIAILVIENLPLSIVQ